MAFGILSASTRAWILAFLANACPIRSAVGTEHTLGPANFVRIAKVLGNARARSGSILLPTDSICSAWGRCARCGLFVDNGITLDGTLGERIAVVSTEANAHRRVTDNATFSIGSTHSWARISALLIDARQLVATVCVRHTFWATIGWRSNVVGDAGARWRIADLLALGIWATWRGLAGIGR